MDIRNDPIEFTYEDQLGRASTAKVFSRALLANPKRPMIVAVFGPWGSGKTSFANLLSAELRLAGAHCVWFNPWQFTHAEAMTVAFFDMLATSLVRPTDPQYAVVRESFHRYAQSISSLGLSPASSPRLSLSKRGFRNLNEGLLAQPSLHDQREVLVRHFADSPRSIIVFIDDIDRLFSSEIRLMIQLAKSNADFPNLKFVLLFQKETVEAALKTDGQTGADFLEKIIEVPIELPLIRGAQYVSDLLREVASIFGESSELARVDNERWQYLLQQGILKNFTTLRQKNRLLDRLHLHRWNTESSLGIDVNLVDLLALEILRAVDYELYSVVRNHGLALTEEAGIQAPQILGQAYLDDLIEEAGPGDHELGRIILVELFSCFGGARFKSGPDEEERSSRISRSAHFPKYFLEGLLPEELSRTGRRQIETAAARGEAIFDLLKGFKERHLLDEALSYLRAVIPTVPRRDWTRVAVDLGRAADDFGLDQERHFGRSVVSEARAIVVEMLADASDKEREKILRAMVQEGSIQLPASLVGSIHSPGAWPDIAITARVNPKLARLIGSAGQEGRLERFEDYGRLLYFWLEWRGGKAGQYVRTLASEPKRFVRFAKAIAPFSRFEAGIAMKPHTSYTASSIGVLAFLPRRVAIRSAKAALADPALRKDEAFLKNLIRDLTRPAAAAVIHLDTREAEAPRGA